MVAAALAHTVAQAAPLAVVGAAPFHVLLQPLPPFLLAFPALQALRQAHRPLRACALAFLVVVLLPAVALLPLEAVAPRDALNTNLAFPPRCTNLEGLVD